MSEINEELEEPILEIKINFKLFNEYIQAVTKDKSLQGQDPILDALAKNIAPESFCCESKGDIENLSSCVITYYRCGTCNRSRDQKVKIRCVSVHGEKTTRYRCLEC